MTKSLKVFRLVCYIAALGYLTAHCVLLLINLRNGGTREGLIDFISVLPVILFIANVGNPIDVESGRKINVTMLLAADFVAIANILLFLYTDGSEYGVSNLVFSLVVALFISFTSIYGLYRESEKKKVRMKTAGKCA